MCLKRIDAMNGRKFIFGVLTFFCAAGAAFANLAEGFANPFGKVRTACYWYWLSGHISAEGARKDIAAMAKGGIDRAFLGDVGAGDCGQGPVRTFTPAWTNALAAAFDEAVKRDVEIGLFNSPGWSQSGGPWIDADRSMRRFAVRTKVVRAGERADVAVPDCGDLSEYRDVVRLAYPLPEGTDAELVAGTNGLFASQSPFIARSLTVELAKPPVKGTVTLEAQDASGAWTRVAAKAFAREKTSLNTGFWPNAPVTLTFAAVTSRHFRVSAPQGVARVVLHAAPNLADVYEKTFAKMLEQPLPRWNDYRWSDEIAAETGLALDPKRMRTVTPDWTPESGTWLVARIGAAPTRVKNAAAVPEATGYETDKMSEDHIRYHLASYLKGLLEHIPHAKEAVKFAVLDSYEVGGQNYTDDFRARFQAAMGYDPQPYYPAFAGVAVGSREMSDRFLWDVRRFVADAVAYSYVGGLRKTCHELGLRTWLECYGHWGFCGEFLQYGGQSDCVAGEFWSEGELGDIENRAASSCAHIYGKKEVWSESDTCSNRPLARGPVELKERTDRFFAEGVNATLLHLYAHQPDDRAPGILAWFGNEFNRHNTWFEHFDIFTGYLKRCSFMLQQGLDVADIAYFIGEDVPRMTGAADPQPPKGRQYDFINAEVLMRDAFVDEKGRLALPHGTRYEVLVLPKLETMRPAFLEKLTQLVRAGLTVVAPMKPTRSPSLAGWPTADARVRELADALWGTPGGIDPALTLEAALARRGSVADFLVHGDAKLVYSHRRDEATDTDIYFVANQSWTPCTNIVVSFRATDRMPEIWDPQTGERRAAWVADLLTERGCPDTAIGLNLAMLESVFVVFRPPVESAADPEPLAASSSVELPGPWTVSFQSDALHRGPKEPLVVEKPFDLSKSTNDCVRFYSGKIVYRTTFVADEPAACRYLSLGDVQVTAKVRVNGKDAGGVCFAPFRVPVAGLVKKGVNELEVEVCNLWVNRLVGDAALPPEERPTWAARPTYGAQTPLRMSGLIGPVTLGFER